MNDMKKLMFAFSILGCIFMFLFVAFFNYSTLVSVASAVIAFVNLYVANVYARLADDDDRDY